MTDTASVVIREIISGDGLSQTQAAKCIPGHRGEGHADGSTIWRWITVGAKTPNGEFVKLEAARIGGRWLTSRSALARFMAALTPNTSPATPIAATRTPPKRRKAAAAAADRLSSAGA